MKKNGRDFQTFVGVDLGGGRGKNTAVATLTRHPDGGVAVRHVSTRTADSEPFWDDNLLAFIAEHPDALLAINAPLTLTSCVRCRVDTCPGMRDCVDETIVWFREIGNSLALGAGRASRKPQTTPYTQRACEIIMRTEHGVVPRETLGQGMGPLAARAHHLRRALGTTRVRDRNLIEVLPKATVAALFGRAASRRYKRHFDTWHVRASMLERLADQLRFEVWREGCLTNDHAFDAVLCAFTGFLWATEGWQVPDEYAAVAAADGWVWFPPCAVNDESAEPPASGSST